MGLTRYKFGELIELTNLKNSDKRYGEDDAIGVNIDKTILPMRGNIAEKDFSTFHLVPPRHFAYNPRGSRKLGIGFNNTESTYIITFNDNVFRIKELAKERILDTYLFMYLSRKEWDRYAEFISWGSSTEVFDWNIFCEEEIDLPPLPIQQKYVDIYNAMIANQQSYERGLENLKIICDGHFDEGKKGRCISLGELIEKVDNRNSNGIYDESAVRGITNKKQFEDTKANLTGTDLSKFKIVGKDEFAYNSRTDGRDMLVLALNRDNENIIVTFNYNVFRIKASAKDFVYAEYLYAYFNRSEFDRRVRFDSWGSSQELLSWESLCDIIVPLPNIEVQNAIAKINNVLIGRKQINEKLKAQIKDICPILIKGSIEEARKIKEA